MLVVPSAAMADSPSDPGYFGKYRASQVHGGIFHDADPGPEASYAGKWFANIAGDNAIVNGTGARPTAPCRPPSSSKGTLSPGSTKRERCCLKGRQSERSCPPMWPLRLLAITSEVTTGATIA